jgi:soluble P-type ATPase
MIEIDIPGYRKVGFEHLVLDFNGTLACDGLLMDGVRERLTALSKHLSIHVVTADTFGKARGQLEGVPCELEILPPGDQDKGKLDIVNRLGAGKTACVGNGRNDRLMLKEAELGIAVVLEEGLAIESLISADIVCTGIISALDLLRNPLRMTATLRS